MQTSPLPRRQLVLELLLVIAFALFVTRGYYWRRPLYGREAEWLTSSVYFAAQSLHKEGRIPLWQPYSEYGEPLINNPFSFVLNPISSAPSLLRDPVWGLNFSVMLTAAVAGLGGWFLGRTLGLGALGRLLLAGLLMGKGNMHAMIGIGYFQLGTAQAYFGWIVGGMLAVLRSRDWVGENLIVSNVKVSLDPFPRPLPRLRGRGEDVSPSSFTGRGLEWGKNSLQGRVAVLITAGAFTLLFWAGNIWYTLPMLVSMAGLLLVHVLREGSGAELRRILWSPPSLETLLWLQRSLDWISLRRVVWVGLFTLGLSAVTLLPLWMERGYIGDHPDDTKGGAVVSLTKVGEQFIYGGLDPYNKRTAPGEPQFYYSFVLPLWFAALIILLPFGYRLTFRDWQVWLVGILMIVLCTLWGAGGNPLFVWLYKHGLGQWRFVGRALAVSSFWIALLVVLRLDGLWKNLPMLYLRGRSWAPLLKFGLVIACAAAVWQVNAGWRIQWSDVQRTQYFHRDDEVCLAWLRDQYPDTELSVYRVGYEEISSFIDHRIRKYNIEADYTPLALPYTFSHHNVTRTLPEFALAWSADERDFLRSAAYEPLEDSPRLFDGNACVYRRPNVPPYAYSVSIADLKEFYSPLTIQYTNPVQALERDYDRIRVTVKGQPEASLLVVGELAYSGWGVKLDGEEAHLESVGGLLGVILPQDERAHQVEFAFRPVWLRRGVLITLLTLVIAAGYLIGFGLSRDPKL